MYKKFILTLLIIGLAGLGVACSGSAQAEPTRVPTGAPTIAGSLPPTEAPQDDPIQPTQAPRPHAPAKDEGYLTGKNEFFVASGNCVVCHRQHIDEAGNDVSIGEHWRGSMMANSAVDPYYLAGVSMNIANFPEYSAAIQSKCSTCHMPMAHTSDIHAGGDSLIFGTDGFLDPQHPLGNLARDGVSCTACHQILDQNLGEFSSFSGGFGINLDLPMGERVLFGRFNLQPMSQRMMAMSSGFVSTQSEHLLESEICATCHNLYTQYVTEDGTFSDDWFPEQTPYSEWLHSDHATRSTCQDCHMPPAEGAVILSNMGPAGPRAPFAQHSFVGGNAYLLGVLNNYGGELGVQAGPEQLDPAIERALSFLGTETAELAISSPEVEGTTILFDVTSTILTGHKFPTGYPSRRTWLHVTVKDGSGSVVFESGGYSVDGAILGNANDQLDQEFEPHYDLITAPDQVQIYETILSDVDDQLTTVLLAASTYFKDNRLLPTGFDKATAGQDIQPKGGAYTDEDFSAGGDVVSFQIDVGDAAGPFTVEAELLYQSISYRWAMDLGEYDTEQALLFSEYYDASPNQPILIASRVTTSE